VFRQANINIPEEHYIFFSEETIKKLRENFHEKNYDNNVNINHNGIKVQGVFLTKSFIINDTNTKDLPMEFGHLPNGTWMAEYRIENKNIWNMIENKELNGFSIEGILDFKYSQ
jgi:hypothetical protein